MADGPSLATCETTDSVCSGNIGLESPPQSSIRLHKNLFKLKTIDRALRVKLLLQNARNSYCEKINICHADTERRRAENLE